jgi:hypothetical protein
MIRMTVHIQPRNTRKPLDQMDSSGNSRQDKLSIVTGDESSERRCSEEVLRVALDHGTSNS